MKNLITGVLPTSTGSEVNRLSRFDGSAINNGNMNELLSERGIEYIRQVIASNVKAGCTVGVASTFRVTPFRAHETGVWDMPDNGLVLPDQYAEWTRKLVDISRSEYKDLPLLGNICPITDTSKGQDDEFFADIEGGSTEARIEFARRLHDAQIRALQLEGIEHLLVEACRHPDDAIAIARSARERGMRSLTISFEAEATGLPDPVHTRSEYGFSDMKSDLQHEAGDGIAVSIGANCIGASRIQNLLDAGDRFDIVYPNQADEDREAPGILKRLKTIANETDATSLRDEIHRALDDAIETPLDELEPVWRQCLETGTSVIGICCGGRPEHVERARKVYDASLVHA